MHFNLYGNHSFDHITLEQLVAEQDDHGMLFARAEHSGSEGCFTEVAIWNPKTRRQERYAFAKFLGGELKIEGKDEATARELAEHCAKQINDAGHVDQYQSIIHNFPNYSGREAVKSA